MPVQCDVVSCAYAVFHQWSSRRRLCRIYRTVKLKFIVPVLLAMTCTKSYVLKNMSYVTPKLVFFSYLPQSSIVTPHESGGKLIFSLRNRVINDLYLI